LETARPEPSVILPPGSRHPQRSLHAFGPDRVHFPPKQGTDLGQELGCSPLRGSCLPGDAKRNHHGTRDHGEIISSDPRRRLTQILEITMAPGFSPCPISRPMSPPPERSLSIIHQPSLKALPLKKAASVVDSSAKNHGVNTPLMSRDDA